MWKSALAAIALYGKSLGICPGVSVQNMLGIGAKGQRPAPGAGLTSPHRALRCVMGRGGCAALKSVPHGPGPCTGLARMLAMRAARLRQVCPCR